MEHSRALESKAVERYLLGEMAQAERDEFEEHYFACGECAEDVRAGARFRANAREVLRDPGQFWTEPRRGFFSWRFPSLAPMAASVLLLGVVVYQAGFEIPSLRRQAGERAIAEGGRVVRLRETTRGDAAVNQIPQGRGIVSLYFDIIADGKALAYPCTITDASGKVVAAPVVDAPLGGESAVIELRRDHLPPGRYSLAVRGGTGTGTQGPGEILSTYEFEMH